MELTSEEKDALNGKHGETMQTAYRILVATGEATDAEKLIPIKWAHLSGVITIQSVIQGNNFLGN